MIPGDKRTSGLGDPWTSGPGNQRTRGTRDQRTRGPGDLGNKGLVDQWNRGPREKETRGPVDQETRETGNQWTCGPVDQGTKELGDQGNQWTSGQRDQETREPVPGSTTHAVFQEPGTSWFTTRTSVFRFPPLRRATYQRVHGEGGPQRHAGLLAVTADEGLLVQDAVALVDLQHLGPAEGDVLQLHCLHLKRGEVR